MRVYLAYPIDLAEPADRLHIQTALAHIRGVVRGHDILIYDPGSAFINTKDATVGPEVRQINMAALDLFECLLVLYPKGSKSWGVPQEIERALDQGKIVVLITDQTPTWSMALDRLNGGLLVIVNPNECIDGWTGAATQALQYLREVAVGTSEPTEGQVGYIEGDPQFSAPPEVLPVKILHTRALGAQLPTRVYPDDAGLDLYVDGDYTIPPHGFVDVRSTVIGIEMPNWSWGFLVGRSSTLRKRGLLVNTGIIDSGWRGGLFAGVWNMTDEPVLVKAGERLAQLIIIENNTRRVEPVEVDAVREHLRGQSGFGSSGV